MSDFLFKLSFCVGVIGFDYADTIIIIIILLYTITRTIKTIRCERNS